MVNEELIYVRLGGDDVEGLLELIKLYQTVFEMEPFEYPSRSYLERILKNDNTIFLVASFKEDIIAGLTAHQLPSTYFEAHEVYVYDLAVHPDHQRKGIGTQLMEELKRISCQKGDKEIFLQADIEDAYAIDFYKKIGGVPENVIHFSFQLGCVQPRDSPVENPEN